MASYAVASTERGVHAKRLVAGVVDVVTFDRDCNRIEVLNTDGTGTVSFTVDGTTPTVGGNNTVYLPAAVGSVEVEPNAPGNTVVRLISDGTPAYSIEDVSDSHNRTVALAASGGGGGAMTVADGADVAQGTTTDAAVVTDANGTLSGKLRGLVKILADVWDSVSHRLKVDGSGVTQPVSAASLPLPSGASTAAKQPALGTAGTASADVISVQGIAGGTPEAVVGQMAMVAASELTRPSDTTAYAALDVVSDSTSAPNVLTFTNLARIAAASGYVVKARLMTDQKTNVARFRLHLFHTAPTAINDNGPFTLLYANRTNRVGHIDFAAAATEDATNSTASSSLNADLRIAFVCAAGDRNLYGILETRDAFTPANGQKFYVELTADQN